MPAKVLTKRCVTRVLEFDVEVDPSEYDSKKELEDDVAEKVRGCLLRNEVEHSESGIELCDSSGLDEPGPGYYTGEIEAPGAKARLWAYVTVDAEGEERVNMEEGTGNVEDR